MSSYAQGSPTPERGRPYKPPGFVRIDPDQLAIPVPPRGEPADGDRLTNFEWRLVVTLKRWCWDGRGCDRTSLQIADAMGIGGPKAERRNKIDRALHGRSYRPKLGTDPGTGKWIYGETKRLPGLISRGWVELRGGPGTRVGAGETRAGTSSRRTLQVTPKFDDYSRIRAFRAGPPKTAPYEHQEPAAGHPAMAEPLAAAVLHEAAPAREEGPSTGDAEAAAATATGADAPRDGETTAAPAGQPSPEVLNEVLGRYASTDRGIQAEQLVGKMGRSGTRFTLGDDGSLRYEVARGYDPLNEGVKAVARWLKPEIVGVLKAEAEKAMSIAAAQAGAVGSAPLALLRAEVVEMIGRLVAHPAADDSDCRATARRLVAEPGFMRGDSNPGLTEETFFGLARDTKRGALPVSVFLGAIEQACGAKKVKRSRGAVLIDAVNRRISALRKPADER